MKKTVTFRLNEYDERDKRIIQIQEKLKQQGIIFSDYIRQAVLEKFERSSAQEVMLKKVESMDRFLQKMYGEKYSEE